MIDNPSTLPFFFFLLASRGRYQRKWLVEWPAASPPTNAGRSFLTQSLVVIHCQKEMPRLKEALIGRLIFLFDARRPRLPRFPREPLLPGDRRFRGARIYLPALRIRNRQSPRVRKPRTSIFVFLLTLILLRINSDRNSKIRHERSVLISRVVYISYKRIEKENKLI